MIEIHDIKPLVEVPDYSLYIFIVLIIFAIVFILAAIYGIYKFFKKNNTLEKQYYNELKNINYEDAKQSAYLITKYVRFLAKNENEKKLSSELIYLLDEYKYKKDIKPISNEIKAKLEIFLETLHV